jgi:hypothetical protein
MTYNPEGKTMWIFLNDAFLSIVADRKSNQLLVRARLPGDIERVFSGVEIAEDVGTDYRFRAWLDREVVAKALSDKAMDINYGNFKGSVQDHARHHAYFGVWEAMNRAQKEALA